MIVVFKGIQLQTVTEPLCLRLVFGFTPVIQSYLDSMLAGSSSETCLSQIGRTDSTWFRSGIALKKSLKLWSCFGWWRSWSRSSLQLWIHLSRGTIRASAATKKADAVNLCIKKIAPQGELTARGAKGMAVYPQQVWKQCDTIVATLDSRWYLQNRKRFHSDIVRLCWGPNQSGRLYVTDRDRWNWVPWAPAAFDIQIV